MNHIVFNTRIDAILRQDEITKECIDKKWTDGVTSTYCELLQHPIKELYAIPVLDGYEDFFTESEIKSATELTKDWFFMGDTKENLELKKQQLLDEIVVVDSKLSAIAVAVDDIAIDEIGK